MNNVQKFVKTLLVISLISSFSACAQSQVEAVVTQSIQEFYQSIQTGMGEFFDGFEDAQHASKTWMSGTGREARTIIYSSDNFHETFAFVFSDQVFTAQYVAKTSSGAYLKFSSSNDFIRCDWRDILISSSQFEGASLIMVKVKTPFHDVLFESKMWVKEVNGKQLPAEIVLTRRPCVDEKLLEILNNLPTDTTGLFPFFDGVKAITAEGQFSLNQIHSAAISNAFGCGDFELLWGGKLEQDGEYLRRFNHFWTLYEGQPSNASIIVQDYEGNLLGSWRFYGFYPRNLTIVLPGENDGEK